MRRICCLLLLLGSPLVLGQDVSPHPDLADPASSETKGACLAECEGVFADCRADGEDTAARAYEGHYDAPDPPVGDCISAGQADLDLCEKDC